MTTTTRDQYVSKLKERLDKWNAEAAVWDKNAHAAKVVQLEAYHRHRDAAVYNLTLLEKASTSAWKDLVSGADTAWDDLQASFKTAREHFAKYPPEKAKKK
jgi:hypothetical protein